MSARSEHLTPRQQEILDFIRQSIEHDSRPPTRADICAAFGFRSPNAAESHLRTLAAKGAILLEEGRARGIRLVQQALGLPLVGRVAAGSPILAAEHVEQHYQLDPATEPLAIGGLTTVADVYAYDPLPAALEPEFAPRILGSQAQLWSEYIPDAAHLDTMTYPRACALAEALWLPGDARDFSRFSAALSAHRSRLSALGVQACPLP